MKQADLAKILAAHKEWVESGYTRGTRADLRSADLSSADLSSANLRYADLRSADLRSADLRSADLSSADLRSADLSSANLRGAENFDPDEHRDVYWIIPEVGAFIGWKKLQNGVIAKLQIPDRAKRTCNLNGRKCRAEYVKTLSMQKDGKPFKGIGGGIYDNGKTKYAIGKITRCDVFDPSPFVECSTGIHFFLCRQEAERYA